MLSPTEWAVITQVATADTIEEIGQRLKLDEFQIRQSVQRLVSEGLLEIEERALERLHEPVTYTEPRDEGDSYRLAEEKQQFDSTTIGFAQTYLNIPVWRTGITVTVKGGVATY